MSIVLGVLMPHPPLIVPDVGKGQERRIQPTVEACRGAAKRIKQARPDVLVVISPHATTYRDYFVVSGGEGSSGSFATFGAPQVKMSVRYHREFVKTLALTAGRLDIPAGTMGETSVKLDHGTMVPLWFLRDMLPDLPIVRIGLSGFSPLDHYRFGRAIAETAESLNLRTVVLASGDLSHKLADEGPYGFDPEGPKFDRIVAESLATGDFRTLLTLNDAMCEAAAECGLRSLQMMAGSFDGFDVASELWSHEGPFGVGYAVATFDPTKRNPARFFETLLRREEEQRIKEAEQNSSPHVRLARRAMEEWVRSKRRFDTTGLFAELKASRAGVFVSIHKEGRLRGCIGTISPTQPTLDKEIVANAIAACSRDPRFDPIREDELAYLELSVDVLGDATPCTHADLDPVRYGVIVRRGHRTGLLLPQLEGVDSIEQQISIALSKAGIEPDEDYTLERFEVVRYH